MAGIYASLIRSVAIPSAMILSLLAAAAPPSLAQPASPGPPRAAATGVAGPSVESSAGRPALRLPADSASHHRLNLAGHSLAYTATAGTLPLHDGEGATTAEIFYLAFTLDGVPDRARRPITYAFNGGPGAASAYLDIGAVGPRVLDLGADGRLPPRSDQVADNPDSWLPFTDLVFIDPVGTGYSRAIGGSEAAAKQFWGVDKDLAALAAVIRLHLTRSGRLNSPVYLLGESYGGFRAARLADELAVDTGIASAGVVLISPALDFGLMHGSRLNLLPWALRLPSYAAAKLAAAGPIAPGALAPVERFALTDYLVALAAGPPEGAATEALYAKLAQLTGLDAAAIAAWRGRIPLTGYLRDPKHGAGRIVSPYDATVSGLDPDPWRRGLPEDPVLDATIAPFTRAFLGYLRDELGFRTDLPFMLLNRSVSRHWDWGGGRHGPGNLGASEALSQALALDPRLRLFIANGITDLTTPYMTSRYISAHLPPAEQPRVTLKLYAGGHMMYLRAGSRAELGADARAFYEATAKD